jgi:hypothetical protein
MVLRRIGRTLIGYLLRLFIATRQLKRPGQWSNRSRGNWLYISDFIQVIDAA